MREIKFRAWEPDEKRMYYPELIAWGKEPMVIDGPIIAMPFCKYPIAGAYKLHELMQFTGLRDKNGAEAWEGDIVNVKRRGRKTFDVAEILWSDAYHAWQLRAYYTGKNTAGDFYGIRTEEIDEFEIIGNIRESPELLEAK